MILPERDLTPNTPISDGRPRHRGLIIFIALLLLVIAGYGGWWYVLAGQTQSHFDAWVADVRASGHKISYGDVSISGFPAHISMDIHDLSFRDATGALEARVPHVHANGIPWRLDQVQGNIGGPITVTDYRSSTPRQYDISADKNDFQVMLTSDRAFKATFADLSISGAGIDNPIRADEFIVGLRGPTETAAVSATLLAHDVTLPKADLSPFGEKVEAFETTIDVLGSSPSTGSKTDRLDSWRQSGGTVEVRRLSVRHGVLGLDSEGTAALDQNLQPVGAFTANITGFNPAVDALVDLGLVKADEGRLAKAALGLFATSPSGGGPKQIEVPLTLQDRRLSVGPFPLIRIPPVHWN